MKDKKLPQWMLEDNTIRLTPSSTKKIIFSDGEVVSMNRKERRRLKLYNNRLKPYQGEQRNETD